MAEIAGGGDGGSSTADSEVKDAAACFNSSVYIDNVGGGNNSASLPVKANGGEINRCASSALGPLLNAFGARLNQDFNSYNNDNSNTNNNSYSMLNNNVGSNADANQGQIADNCSKYFIESL